MSPLRSHWILQMTRTRPAAPVRTLLALALSALAMLFARAVIAQVDAGDDIRLDTAMADPQAATLLTPVVAARRAAAEADAALYAEDDWRRAQSRFDRLLGDVERGRTDTAELRAEETAALYRTAHSSALQTVLLAGARSRLRDALRSDLPALTPTLTAAASRLLDDAAAALVATPEDPQAGKALASQAERTLAHARLLAALLRPLPRKGGTEQVMLQWESTLIEIVEALSEADVHDGPAANGGDSGDSPTPAGDQEEIPPEVAKALAVLPAEGPVALGASAAERAAQLRRRVDRLEVELETRNALIRELQDRLAEVDDALDDTARARAELADELAARELARERLERMDEMFGPSEAVILRELDTIVLRLTGASFTVGGTGVTEQTRALLDKVADAIRLFPASIVVIEGHTDSSGDSATNQRVSEKRANSVRDVLLELTGMAPVRMTSRGFGESRPVASNETREGRANNRRIEVRINPRDRIGD
jgi:OOP family OmpA-OmpF porin